MPPTLSPFFSQLKLKALLLHFAFLILLIPHILADHFLIHTYGINTIAIRPKMVSPIGFCLQIRVMFGTFESRFDLSRLPSNLILILSAEPAQSCERDRFVYSALELYNASVHKTDVCSDSTRISSLLPLFYNDISAPRSNDTGNATKHVLS